MQSAYSRLICLHRGHTCEGREIGEGRKDGREGKEKQSVVEEERKAEEAKTKQTQKKRGKEEIVDGREEMMVGSMSKTNRTRLDRDQVKADQIVRMGRQARPRIN